MNFDEVLDRRKTGSMKWDIAPGPLDPDRHIVPLSVADMEFRSPRGIREALKDLADQGIWGYTGPRDDYFTAVNRWFTLRHDFPIDRDWLVPTTGVVQAVFSAVRAFSSPGDKVLVQTPVYYPFFRAVEENGRQLLSNELRIADDRYIIDFEDFEKKMAQPPLHPMQPHNRWAGLEMERSTRCRIAAVDVLVTRMRSTAFYLPQEHTISARPRLFDPASGCPVGRRPSLAAWVQVSLVRIRASRKLQKQIRKTACTPTATLGLRGRAAYTVCDDWYEASGFTFTKLSDPEKIHEEALRVSPFLSSGPICLARLSEICCDHENLECMVNHQLYLTRAIFRGRGRGFERNQLAVRARSAAALDRLKRFTITQGRKQ